MKPSSPVFKIPGGIDDEKIDPAHDAISAWLLRASYVPGFFEYLLALTPGMALHDCRYEGRVDMEVPVMQREYIKGFADGAIRFHDGTRLWLEIKTDDKAIGALIRQIKSYRHLLGAEGQHWLAILPHASAGAAEFLRHEKVGVYIVGEGYEGLPPMSQDLSSMTDRLAEQARRARFEYEEIPTIAAPQGLTVVVSVIRCRLVTGAGDARASRPP
jgi:hypothetical protein